MCAHGAVLDFTTSPVSVILLSIEAVPVHFPELDACPVEEVGVDLVEPKHAADELLVEQKVAVHGVSHDAGHLRGDELHIRVALPTSGASKDGKSTSGGKLFLSSL